MNWSIQTVYKIVLGIFILKKLTLKSKSILNDLSGKLCQHLSNIISLSNSYYKDKIQHDFSTNPNGLNNFDSFWDAINQNLLKLNYCEVIKEEIEKVQSNFLKQELLKKIQILIEFFEKHLSAAIKKHLKQNTTDSINHIRECISGDCFFNLTNKSIPDNVITEIKKGGKFNPIFVNSFKEESLMFKKQFLELVNSFLKYNVPGVIKLDEEGDTIVQLQLLYELTLRKNDKYAYLIKGLIENYETQSKLFKRRISRFINGGRSLNHMTKLFDFDRSTIILESDKGLGYVLLSVQEVFRQYLLINNKQHFGKTQVTEEWYLDFISNILEMANNSIPRELSNILKANTFQNTIENPCIGTLRLMPKILKLKTICYDETTNLVCRGIKSSLCDPITIIQKAIDKIFDHLLYFLEIRFNTIFETSSPSVMGIDEAIVRTHQARYGTYGESIELEGDFSDLYSNCNKQLLIECVKKCCKFANLHETTFNYIVILIEIEMDYSFFHEPSGIFKTLSGFSMGDIAAAKGSEIILRTYELDIYKKLKQQKVFNCVKKYLRFRDDVSSHFWGTKENMKKAINIIVDGYPKDIHFNVQVNLLQGKFLNIRCINNPKSESAITTILRKKNCKYNIIIPTSNVEDSYKKCAGSTYFRTIKTHVNDKLESKRQKDIVRQILESKGFKKDEIDAMEKNVFRKRQKDDKEKKRKFIGTLIYDRRTKRHKFINNIFIKAGLDLNDFRKGMCVPGVKLHSCIFSIRKMRRKLNF